jgi:26S proteasome regulatory subunit N8
MFEPSQVVVHPLVLLSIVDHYNRVTLGSKKRVVGVLLGSVDKEGKVDVTNSYARMCTHTLLCRASQHIAHSSSYCEAAATSHPPLLILLLLLSRVPSHCCRSLVPFDEDDKKAGIWFLDHNYHENMYTMFKKVNGMTQHLGHRAPSIPLTTTAAALCVSLTDLPLTAPLCTCCYNIAREKLVGWYSTGPKIRASDLDINTVFRRYTTPDVCSRVVLAHLHLQVLIAFAADAADATTRKQCTCDTTGFRHC